ncbi:ParB/Srx family N-terminal domain-containing protein [Streptomyces sp. PTM05]|uniref:ParB/Srx family N-terminal domain-containing protein n=1 Tax=Streptantibioticus parmotrematis TaxID=2873249 RepID=A0ABS7QNL2_9ACTN|nr:ParB/Srx family N-terminal domain-containing protein [Streptantibioticus parmotrematis]MBY8884757.1 ParB/Srx family N-terminal domain-containing protein [Streptantibioticus parmotrematis]
MEDSTQLAPPRMVQGDPRTLTLLDVNARFLPHEQFRQLVANVRRDGCLTSTPLVWNDTESGRLVVLSGNHRTLAAIEAGLTEIWWMQIDQPLARQRQIALQLSHNAIAGQDDPAILKELYDELESVEWRQYTGLDDKALDLLEKVDVSSLGEANLDFASVQFMFLPAELERAEAAFDAARSTAAADQRWIAGLEQYEPMLDALETSRAAYTIGNSATALGVILTVFERHLGELADGWYDPATAEAHRGGTAPLESVFGVREIPVETAAVVRAVIDRLVEDGSVPRAEPWRALDILAARGH